ncbi:MAG: signal peptidase I [Victivallales bacterium]|nr:signal peptidase I [Victivallales bacterium]
MSLPIVILLDLLLIYFFFGSDLVEWLTPPKKRPRREFKALLKGFRALVHRNRDLLSEHQLAATANLLGDGANRLAANDAITAEDVKKYSGKIDAMMATLPVPQNFQRMRNWVETIVVSAGVAFAIRSLLLSPFSIPTGSMQPTLYGIHYVAMDAPAAPGSLKRAFDYLNYSQRQFRLVAPADGSLDYESLRPAKSYPLFPNSELEYRPAVGAPVTWRLPANLTDAQKTLLELYGDTLRNAARDNFPAYMAGVRPQLRFKKDDVVFNGAMESGDHLFVNRLSLAFTPPRRGQVMVFMTNGLNYNGQPLSGDYYIKRLVGLPGDTLKIIDRALWVKPAGEADFHKLDAEDHPGFAKINSKANGYKGYANILSSSYLRFEGEEFTVPAEHYFMLGDNTENSLDSRFWGAVPRENLVGRPCFVWWPFSKHFGFVDRPMPQP